MYLPDFEVFEPGTVEEACELLDKHKKQGIAVLAGGTDFLVDIRPGIIRHHVPRCGGCSAENNVATKGKNCPPYVMSIARIPVLKGISVNGNNVKISAMTTIRELCQSSIIREKLSALHDGAVNLGSPLVRNRGTIGGNIANARPAGDTFIPAVTLNAKLLVQSVKGTREIPVASFATGPGKTVLDPTELILQVIFPLVSQRCGSAYYKLANRKALEIAVVGIGSRVVLAQDNDVIQSATIGMGAVGPKPLLASNAMEYLRGKPIDDKTIKQAAVMAMEDATPITDHRGTREYRRMEIEVLTYRTLSRAIQIAKQDKSK